jgi:galactoside O-acetyltransferase
MNVFDPHLFERLRSVGRNVRIGDYVKIVSPENLSIGDHVILDDFTFINPGEGSSIGSHVHIASFCCLSGGGTFEIADFANLSSRVAIYTGSDDFHGESLTNPTVPPAYRAARVVGCVRVAKHVVLGTGCTVLENASLGEGCAVGAMSLVKEDVAPWTIVAGVPVRVVGTRRSDVIRRMEEDLRKEENEQ